MVTGLPWQAGGRAGRPTLTTGDVDAVVATAHALVDAASVPALAHFRDQGLAAMTKGHKPAAGWDPVTVADRAAEEAMRAVLARSRPDDGIVGEEFEVMPGTSGLTWVIDPIDGTRAYLAGLPTWCVLVAAFDGVEPIVGLVAQPFTGERWLGLTHGDRRRTTWHRGDTWTVLDTGGRQRRLAQAVLHTTFPEVGDPEERAAFERVRDAVRLTRYGGDAYGYALVASGTIDLVVEAGLAPHDVQAVIPVVRGAGGVISDWAGGPCHAGGRVVAAATPALHRAALELLA